MGFVSHLIGKADGKNENARMKLMDSLAFSIAAFNSFQLRTLLLGSGRHICNQKVISVSLENHIMNGDI
jgi:hypothetical protein